MERQEIDDLRRVIVILEKQKQDLTLENEKLRAVLMDTLVQLARASFEFDNTNLKEGE